MKVFFKQNMTERILSWIGYNGARVGCEECDIPFISAQGSSLAKILVHEIYWWRYSVSGVICDISAQVVHTSCQPHFSPTHLHLRPSLSQYFTMWRQKAPRKHRQQKSEAFHSAIFQSSGTFPYA
jgi:hypothetical protein